MVERARQSREELATFRQQQAEGPDGDDSELASPAKRRAAQRRASKQAERLELAAADNLSQVCAASRLALCWTSCAMRLQPLLLTPKCSTLNVLEWLRCSIQFLSPPFLRCLAPCSLPAAAAGMHPPAADAGVA